MAYVDGFIVPVPTANKDAYKAFAEKWGTYFKGLGALSMYECWADDVPEGEVTDFQRAVALKDGEAVLFSWTLWPDKDTRNAAWEKLAAETAEEDMPFDGKRMIFGGFKPLVVME